MNKHRNLEEIIHKVSYLNVRRHFVCIFKGLAGPIPMLLQRRRKAVGVLFAVLADNTGRFRLQLGSVFEQYEDGYWAVTVNGRMLPNMMVAWSIKAGKGM